MKLGANVDGNFEKHFEVYLILKYILKNEEARKNVSCCFFDFQFTAELFDSGAVQECDHLVDLERLQMRLVSLSNKFSSAR